MSPAIAEPPTEEQPAVRAAQPPLPEADARFTELAAAVRRHQRVASRPAVPKRPADHALYRKLTELERD